MKRGGSRSGQPLVALFVILGGWATARTAAWELVAQVPSPAGTVAAVQRPEALSPVMRAVPRVGEGGSRQADAPPFKPSHSRNLASSEGDGWPAAAEVRVSGTGGVLVQSIVLPPAAPLPSAPGPSGSPAAAGARVQTAMGHQLLWMAAVSRMPMPFRLADDAGAGRHAASPQPFYPLGHEPLARTGRWSADGWLMLRNGSSGRLAAGGAPASYGASQAGAVLRYRLDPGNSHRPAAYLRVSAALDGSRDRELAVGLAARPLSALPIVASAELRASNNRAGTRLRPAAMVVSELPPVALPLAARLEAYGQAGYVGGRDATAFADGQLRVDRQVTRFRLAEVRAGMGAWAGAQKGASRVDVGPTMTLGVPAGKNGSMRLSMDWRFRVAGRATPASGPALTLSAGF